MDTRQIIDYAQQDDGTKFRETLYANIHDKVMAHITTKTQEIAKNLIVPQESNENENA